MLVGLVGVSTKAFADKKANEGQNTADIEFYEPTPEKVKPVLPETKKPEIKPTGIKRLLPKTGETTSNFSYLLGLSILSLVFVVGVKRRKVGDVDE